MTGLGVLDRVMQLPNGGVAAVRLGCLGFWLCVDLLVDGAVSRRAGQVLLQLLQDKYASAAAEGAAAKVGGGHG